MPCTPTNGLSHSYISQWANLTMLHQSSSIDTIPSLDPIPSPARGRVRRRKDENDDECPTPRDRMSNCSPQPRANRSRPSRRQAPPTLLPTLHFRRLAHKPLDRPPLQRTPSDVTNKQRDEATPSPDLIFNMSPVLGFDGPSRPNRVASHLSEELLKDTPQTTPQPASFMYAYTWDTPSAEPYAQSLTLSAATSGLLADNDHTSEADESALSHLEESELASCLVDVPAMPRLGRLHAKSDPLPARLSSSPASFLDSGRAQPIPIPKPSLRVPSDYGGVSSVSMSVAPPTQSIPIPARYARVPAAARERKKRRDVPVPVQEEPEPVPAVRRKKRFFLGESYDGDMDSELSSWRP